MERSCLPPKEVKGLHLSPADSLIDRTKSKQINYPNAIVCTQVPFKSNDTRSRGAFSGNRKTPGNFVTPLKCFYIRMGNCYRQQEEALIVTGIPSSYQVENDPTFDFPDKPNFDGIILYSKTDGTTNHNWKNYDIVNYK